MTVSTYASENLSRCFGDLIEDDRITEISVNTDGRVWIERVGDPAMSDSGKVLDVGEARSLGQDLAGETPISDKTPLAGSEFAINESLWRSQVVAPPVVDGCYSISLRRSVSEVIPLKTLIGDASLKNLVAGHNREDEAVFAALERDDFEGFLSEAIRAKWNILFSGGTSSGKTTWLRACVDLIPKEERIVTIEDVYEMRPPHENRLCLKTSRSTGSSDLLKASLRLRPDRLMMGELRAAEAFDFLSVINSGHPGAITTLHADSPEGAIRRLAKMVMQAGKGMTQSEIVEDCEALISLVLQLSKIDGVRRPTGIKILRPRAMKQAA